MHGRKEVVPLLLVIFLISFFPKKHQDDCGRFRVGKFVYRKDVPDSAIIINRNDSIQIETDPKKSFVLRERVTWKNPCEYELIFLSRVPDYPPGYPVERKVYYDKARRIPLQTKIVVAAKNYYVFESRKEGIDIIYKDTMWVLK
jgi:hypothetical protein